MKPIIKVCPICGLPREYPHEWYAYQTYGCRHCMPGYQQELLRRRKKARDAPEESV